MYCKQCGTQLQDGSAFCSACGAQQDVAPQNVAPAAAPQDSAPQGAAPQNAPRRKKTALIVTIAAVALVAVGLVLFFLLRDNGGDSLAPIKAYMSAYETGDYRRLKGAVPEAVYEDRYFEDDFYDAIEELDDEYGTTRKMTCKKLDEEALEGEDFEELREVICDRYDLLEKKLTAIHNVEIRLSIEGSQESDTSKRTVIVYCYDGSWYLAC